MVQRIETMAAHQAQCSDVRQYVTRCQLLLLFEGPEFIEAHTTSDAYNSTCGGHGESEHILTLCQLLLKQRSWLIPRLLHLHGQFFTSQAVLIKSEDILDRDPLAASPRREKSSLLRLCKRRFSPQSPAYRPGKPTTEGPADPCQLRGGPIRTSLIPT